MSNRAYVELVVCQRLKGTHKWVEAKVYDEYSDGTVTIPSEEGKPADCGVNVNDDLSVLQYLIGIDSDVELGISSVIDSVLEKKNSITVEGTTYEWEEIKHLFGEDE